MVVGMAIRCTKVLGGGAHRLSKSSLRLAVVRTNRVPVLFGVGARHLERAGFQESVDRHGQHQPLDHPVEEKESLLLTSIQQGWKAKMAATSFLPIFSSRLLMNSHFTNTRLNIAVRYSGMRRVPNQPSSTQSYHTSGSKSSLTVSNKECWFGRLHQQRTWTTHNPHLCIVPQPLSWSVVRCYAKKVKKEKVVKGGKKKVELNAEELDGVLDLTKLQDDMQAVVEDLKQQMINQVSIRTNIGAYDKLPVKTEDGVFPLIQLGQVVQKSPTLILVNLSASPQYIPAVKDAITQSGLNVNPQQDGTTIFIPVPKVTREHREGLAKNAKMIHDKAKTRLRDIHNKYVKKVKAAKDSHSEDILKGAQDMVLEEMHSYVQQLDAVLTAKQQELLGGK